MYTIDAHTQQQVLLLLHWSEQQYGQFIYDCGLAYLSAYLPKEEMGSLSAITKTETYWDWWKYRWEKRDMEFIEYCAMERQGAATRIEIYKEIHDPIVLASGIYLNGKILEESYCVMMNELIKKETCQHS